MAQETFQRYEKKFLLTASQYHALLPQMKRYMKPDTYGKYTICNIYFDTPDYQLIRTSLEKPFYKEKLRLRSYGVPQQDSTVFVEIKKKCDGIVYKRRSEMTLQEAQAYLYRDIHPVLHSQIMQELDWFKARYPLHPAVYIAYDREAYSEAEPSATKDSELRVTFDTAIRFREENLTLSAGTEGTLLLPQDTVLMEVKIPGAMPLWMAQLLSRYRIYPTSFSKYGTYYQQIHLQKGTRKYA